jgi:hypothetical protein
MSVLAQDLLELRRFAKPTEPLLISFLREAAANLIAPGVASELGGL